MNLDNEAKAIAALAGLAGVAALWLPWVDTFTTLSAVAFPVFVAVHLPIVVAGLFAVLQATPIGVQANLPGMPAARALLLVAPVSHLCATLAYRSRNPGGFSFSAGFWITWLLCGACAAVVIARRQIAFLNQPTVTAPTAGGPSSPQPQPPPPAQPSPPASVGSGGDAVSGWVAVPLGTSTVTGEPVQAGVWLQVVSAGALTVVLADDTGKTFEVRADTTLFRP